MESVLKLRYGLSELSFLESFDDELKVGRWQFVLGASAAIGTALVVVALLGFGLVVQIASAREILSSPNYSNAVSISVIAYIVLVDVIVLTLTSLTKVYQPYQTMSDFHVLTKISERDPEGYNAVIKEMVRRHYSRGFILRLLTRPKLKRF